MTTVSELQPPPRAVREPHAARAARQVQALGPRLGLVAAQPARADGDLLARLRVLPQGRPARRRPERAARVRVLPAVRPAAVDLPRQRRSPAGWASLLANANLVKKVWFPRELLVAATVGSFGVSFLIELGVLVGRCCSSPATWCCPWLLPVARRGAVQAVFVLGPRPGAGGVVGVLPRPRVPRRDRAPVLVLRHADRLPDQRRGGRARRPTRCLLDALPAEPDGAFVEVYRDLLYALRVPTLGHVALPGRRAPSCRS